MKKKILIVDDDAPVRESLRKLLEASGYAVELAAGRRQAEAALDKENVDLLIIDLQLSHHDGWEVVGHVSSQSPWLPVLLVTSDLDQLDPETLPAMCGFLEKPIDPSLLLRKIGELLSDLPGQPKTRLAEPALSTAKAAA